MAESDRLVWLDALRLMAGLSMVGLHATTDPSGQPWPAFPAEDRVGPIVVRSLLYVARTELFIVISVFLLMIALERRPRTYTETIAEQARRLLIPFAFWTLFYAGYSLIKASAFGYLPASISEIQSVLGWMGFILLGNVKYHMHFIPTLFGIILMFPLFRLAVRYPVLGLSILICLVVRRELDGFIYSTFWDTEALPFAARGIKILTYAGYGLVAASAYGIWKRYPAQKLEAFVPLAIYTALLALVVKAVGGYLTIVTGKFPFDYTAGYWADFLMPVILFLSCMILGGYKWPETLSRLAPYSFGVYLCHPIFLDIAEIGLQNTQFSPIQQVLTKIVLVLPATALLVIVIRNLPAFAWTIGLGPLPKFRVLSHQS